MVLSSMHIQIRMGLTIHRGRVSSHRPPNKEAMTLVMEGGYLMLKPTNRRVLADGLPTSESTSADRRVIKTSGMNISMRLTACSAVKD